MKYSLLAFNSKYSPIFATAGHDIDTPAADKIVITLKHPLGAFLVLLSGIGGGAIMPAHLYRRTDVMTNPTTSSTPVGTGAFKFVGWKHGDFVRLQRVTDYEVESGHPYLDEIIAKIISDPTARIQALQAGVVGLVPFP